MKKEKPQFTREFKAEAVKLWEASGRKSTLVGKQLGITPHMLPRWHEALGRQKTSPARCLNTQATGSFSDVGAALAAENARLKRENERLKMEHEILKKPWPSSRRSPNDL